MTHRAALAHSFAERPPSTRSARRYVGTVGATSGARRVVVVVEDGPLYELPTRRDLAAHARDFLWGQPGPGTRQLALAILADALVDADAALALHETFAHAVTRALPAAGFTIELATVLAWVRELEDDT